MKKVTEITGWAGVLAVLLSYFLVSLQFWQSTNPAYQILNLAGSLALTLVSVRKKAYSLSLFYLFWAIVALISLVRMVS